VLPHQPDLRVPGDAHLLCAGCLLCRRHLHHHLPERDDVLERELSANLPVRPIQKLH
jgi:hypothetical protein